MLFRLTYLLTCLFFLPFSSSSFSLSPFRPKTFVPTPARWALALLRPSGAAGAAWDRARPGRRPSVAPVTISVAPVTTSSVPNRKGRKTLEMLRMAERMV